MWTIACSVTTEEEAIELVRKLRTLLAKGGFDIRQWASNKPAVLRHLPSGAKSEASETWGSQTPGEAQEMTLGLIWHFKSDTLHYRYALTEPHQITEEHLQYSRKPVRSIRVHLALYYPSQSTRPTTVDPRERLGLVLC